MAEKLTNEQQSAVDSRERSLLVSAAAGSGKTKVLVERLFSYVEREGANLDDFLIITYTRAAASELRGKIAKALNERMERDPGNYHLRQQMLRVYRADIKTVDAFCTSLLRENCHLLGEDARGHALRPDFRVLDENEAEVLRGRVLARTLEDFYDHLTSGGTLLADTLGAGRDDSALEQLVLELHAKLQAQPYEDKWLDAQRAFWRAVPEKIEDTPYGKILLNEVGRKARHCKSLLQRAAQEMCANDALNQKYAPAFLDASYQLEALEGKIAQGWDAARGVTIAFPRLAAVKDSDGGEMKARMKGLWDNCKETVKGFAELFAASSDEAVEDLRTMAPAMLALIDLTADFSRRYNEEKRRRNAADFSDQEHEAIRLLVAENGEPTELAALVSTRYREIMVDEYQDTNEVQNRIFDAISCKGENLFTVGDVKQSIYRFRLADPRIFLQHYNTWPPLAAADEHESAKLLLSRNFRSRKEVLEATNFVFRNVLSREMGELDYGEDEMLRPGASYAESSVCGAEFHLLDLPTQTGEHRVRASEAEAAFVADYIHNMLSSKFPVQDDKTRELRPVREEDIVILMRSPSTRLPDYRRALESRGIRCVADAGEDFFASMEIAVLFSFLQVIDNPRQDVPLIAVLRSPLFGFVPDELAALRSQQRTGDFYDALLLSEDGHSKAFLAVLRSLRDSAAHLSVRELLSEIYRKCNVLGIFGAMHRGAERKDNLLAFLELSEDFARTGRQGLFDFVRTLREQLASGEAAAMQTTHASSGVRIMSIHKSKGLEFPVVILSDLARRFSNMDFQSSVLVHPQLGLGPVCVDARRHIQYPTIARQALERTLRREAKAEELRVLYVAMTRAKEKLVMVHTQANAGGRVADLMALSDCPVLPEAVDSGKCMGDWIMLPLLQRSEAGALRAFAGQNSEGRFFAEETPWTVCVHDGLQFAAPAQQSDAAAEERAPQREELPADFAALSYRYPYAEQTAFPAKLTATQLKGRAIDEEISENTTLPPRLRNLCKPKFLAGKTALTGAERGTALHLVMQDLDFFCEPNEQSVRAQIEAMRAQRKLTEEQAKAADAYAIVQFLRSDLAARIRKSEQVEREYRFSLLRPVRDFSSLDADDSVLLQGVVDCFFEEDGELVVVDFKTDHVLRAQLDERAEHYRPQLEAYSMALTRVMGKKVKEKVLYFFSAGEEVRL
ncbi:MAG: helicase-exonuclease AddAB subunit AddA [Oscillospiraceae bacterium]